MPPGRRGRAVAVALAFPLIVPQRVLPAGADAWLHLGHCRVRAEYHPRLHRPALAGARRRFSASARTPSGCWAPNGGVSFWAGLPAGVALSAVFGYAVGSLCLRSKGHYFAIFTLAVGLIIHLVIQKWESLTHGHIGVIGIPGPGAIGPIDFGSSVGALLSRARLSRADDLATRRLLHSPVGPHAHGDSRERGAGGVGRARRHGGQADGVHIVGGRRRPRRRPLCGLHRISRTRSRRAST